MESAATAREATVTSLVKDAKSGLHSLRETLEGRFARFPDKVDGQAPSEQAPNILDDILSDLTEINGCIKDLHIFIEGLVLNKIS